MEILKFSEPPKRSSRTSTRKKSGVMPLLSVVAAVAIVGGMSSTLAGTITLNSSGSVEFGQGVVTAAACDTTMEVIPAATYTNSANEFKVTAVTLKGVGLAAASNAALGSGCKGKTLTIKAYASGSDTPLTWNGTSQSIIVTLPNTDTLTATAILKTQNESVTVTAANYGTTSPVLTDDITPSFTLGGLSYASTVVRFTIESSGGNS
jgi:hypothetical protein